MKVTLSTSPDPNTSKRNPRTFYSSFVLSEKTDQDILWCVCLGLWILTRLSLVRSRGTHYSSFVSPPHRTSLPPSEVRGSSSPVVLFPRYCFTKVGVVTGTTKSPRRRSTSSTFRRLYGLYFLIGTIIIQGIIITELLFGSINFVTYPNGVGLYFPGDTISGP